MECRILRSKVLKMLDENFKKRPFIIQNLNDDDDLDLGYELPQHLKKTSLIARLKQSDSSFLSKSIEGSPDSRSRSPNLSTGLKAPIVPISKAEELNVKNLCRFLTGKEIELICEDPIYFLGRNEYQKNPNLNVYKDWERELNLVYEKRRKENNWKETHDEIRMSISNSPKNAYYEQMSSFYRPSFFKYDEGEDRIKAKEQKTKIFVSRLKQKSEQLNSIVKLRKEEEEDERRKLEASWIDKIESKNFKTQAMIQQKKDRIQEIIFQSQQGRGRTQQKLKEFRRSRDDEEEFRKINYEISSILKQKVAEQHKSIDLSKKIEKAKITAGVSLKRIASNKHKRFNESNTSIKDTIWSYGYAK